ncbi:Mur ligase family protein, partial [Salmonella enterica subsp. enterica serovar Enteritidis]|uniref:Mur ligase family protein n=1 Tax=Salmonella enterica TaxID=28901 RepID=UPI0039E8C0DA
VDYAVLETARGGMLLRGCGFEAADVAVITNVTEDHLGVQGVHSIEGLAAVKSIIARNVKPGGFCVLNADDHRVRAMAE